MSKDADRFELEAIKDGFARLTRKPAPDDVPIPFTEKGCRRVGEIIARAATTPPPETSKKPKTGSE